MCIYFKWQFLVYVSKESLNFNQNRHQMMNQTCKQAYLGAFDMIEVGFYKPTVFSGS